MKLNIKLKNVDEEFKKLLILRTEENTNKSRATVSKLVDELKVNTPVDTGFAQNSWSVTEGKNIFNIENSAPYIQYLNEGSSAQAPARFIEAVALKYGKPIGTIVQVKDE